MWELTCHRPRSHSDCLPAIRQSWHFCLYPRQEKLVLDLASSDPGETQCLHSTAKQRCVLTRKLYYRKDDRTMRFCCAILLQYWYDPAIKLRSSDVKKGAWQMPCRNYGLRPGLPLVSPKFLHVPLGVVGWPLGYEERICWANCSHD